MTHTPITVAIDALTIGQAAFEAMLESGNARTDITEQGLAKLLNEAVNRMAKALELLKSKEGYQLVPKEPTWEMILAAEAIKEPSDPDNCSCTSIDPDDAYRTMLAVAMKEGQP